MKMWTDATGSLQDSMKVIRKTSDKPTCSKKENRTIQPSLSKNEIFREDYARLPL
jgi:hypothetical protein